MLFVKKIKKYGVFVTSSIQEKQSGVFGEMCSAKMISPIRSIYIFLLGHVPIDIQLVAI